MRSMGFAVSALVLAAAAARADIDVETAAAIKAKSTLSPQGETETFRFDATAGTRLSFSLVAARGASLQFAPVLTAPDASEVDLSGVLTVKPKGVTVSGLGLTQTGSYALTVAATGAGDYALSLTGTPQTRFPAVGQLDPNNPQPLDFSAPPGSKVTFSAKAAKGSAATPRFGDLTGVGFETLFLAPLGRATATSHTVPVEDIGGTGDFSVVVGNIGELGNVVVSIAVKPPRRKPAKLDLRAKTLGRPLGGETFYGRAIGPEGGSVDVPDDGSDLDRAAVSVPAGALAAPLTVSIASAVTPPSPSDDQQPAGPAVDLRPSGTVFLSPVTVTLPFEFSQVPANAEPGDIRVLVIEDDGSTRTIVPSAVDANAGTVTVLTTGFSICVPIVTSGPPRLGLAPGGDEYWTMFITLALNPAQTGNDSREREYSMEVGEASFFGDGTVQASAEERRFHVDNPDALGGGVNGSTDASAETGNFNGNWNYGADGQSIEVTGAEDTPVFQVSRDGSVMIGRGRGPASDGAELDILLRKNTSPLSVASLAGVYSLVGFELSADSRGFGTATKVEPSSFVGTLTLDGEGGASFAITERLTEFDNGTGSWRDSVGSMTGTATYSVEAEGTVLLDIPPEEGDEQADILRLFPGPGANSFLCTDRDPQAGDLFALFVVRQGSGVSRAALSGRYRLEDVSVTMQTYQSTGVSPVTVADLGVADEDVAAVFDGSARAVSFQSALHDVHRNGSFAGGVRIQNSNDSYDVAVAVGSKGNLTLSDADEGGSFAGAIAADGMFGFFVSGLRNDPAASQVLGVLVRLPPAP